MRPIPRAVMQAHHAATNRHLTEQDWVTLTRDAEQRLGRRLTRHPVNEALAEKVASGLADSLALDDTQRSQLCTAFATNSVSECDAAATRQLTLYGQPEGGGIQNTVREYPEQVDTPVFILRGAFTLLAPSALRSLATTGTANEQVAARAELARREREAWAWLRHHGIHNTDTHARELRRAVASRDPKLRGWRDALRLHNPLDCTLDAHAGGDTTIR